MERESVIYKTRRKLQVIASYVIPKALLSKIYFRIVMKDNLDLDNPETFNEKLQWLKLYYYPYSKTVVDCADKYAVREYIESKGLGNLLNELIGTWTDAKQINWKTLPKQFVLKCNHGCAYNLICDDINHFDKGSAIKQLNKWLKEDFGAFNIEPHYSRIKPRRIICEKYLGSNITDYKFFCLNGKPKFLYVSEDLIHDRQARIGFYDVEGNKIPLVKSSYADLKNVVFPTFYKEMLEDAEVLAKDFPFVRVDYFVTSERFYFAELTFTPGGCMNEFNPSEYDKLWGKELDISQFTKSQHR